ncbi:hypothetical protein FHG87_015537 [Trinorchestia longiramus]|nr:hypothetical protein FHG87_015537 [Trinorchestia longiramus]
MQPDVYFFKRVLEYSRAQENLHHLDIYRVAKEEFENFYMKICLSKQEDGICVDCSAQEVEQTDIQVCLSPTHSARVIRDGRSSHVQYNRSLNSVEHNSAYISSKILSLP